MEISVSTRLFDAVDGVFPARKRNSANSQATLIKVGIETMQSKRLGEIAIPELAKSCGVSVGAFYARFRDKEAYFRALQAQTIYENSLLIQKTLHDAELSALLPTVILDRIIRLLITIFNSPYRGVLRESYMRSQGDIDYWVDMRASGREIQQKLVDTLKHHLPELSEQEAEIRLRFAYQTTVGILQNDLVNSFHVFKASDEELATELNQMLGKYLGLKL